MELMTVKDPAKLRATLMEQFGPSNATTNAQKLLWQSIIDRIEGQSTVDLLNEDYVRKIANCAEIGSHLILAIDEVRNLLGPVSRKTHQFLQNNQTSNV